MNERLVLLQLFFCAYMCSSKEPLKLPHTHLDDCLFSYGARPPLAGVEPLFHGEATSMRLEPLDQQVVDSSKVVVAFVL